MQLSLRYFAFSSFLLFSAILLSASKYLPSTSTNSRPNKSLPTSNDTLPSLDGGNTCADAVFLCDGLDGLTDRLDSFDIQQIYPGCNMNVLNNPDWYAFVAGSTSISMVITPSNCQGLFGNIGLQAAIYAQCGEIDNIPLAMYCPCADSAFTLSSSNFVVGEVYYIVFDGCSGDICDYSVNVLEGNTAGTLAVLGSSTPPCSNATATYSIGSGQFDVEWLPIEHAIFDTLSGGDTIAVTWDSAFIGNTEICAIVSGPCFPLDTLCLQVSVGGSVPPVINGVTSLCAGDTALYHATALTCQYTELYWEVTNGSLLTNQGQTDMEVLWSDTASAGEICVNLVTTTGDTLTDCHNVALHYCLPCDSLVAEAGSFTIDCYTISFPPFLVGTTNAIGDSLAFIWTYNGAIISTSDTVSFQQIGTYVFTVMDLTTGCAASDVFEFVVNAEPPIAEAGPDMALGCFNDFVVLDASNSSTGPQYAYEWTGLNGPPVDSITVTVTEPGLYTLMVTNLANGCASADYVLVNGNVEWPMLPILSTPDTCHASIGTATLMIPPGTPPHSLLWNTGDTTASIHNLPAGEYQVVFNIGSCTSTYTVVVDSVACTATHEANADLSLQLLPNPNNGYFTVQLDLPKALQLQLDLVDVLGQVVNVIQPTSLLGQGKHVFEVDADLPSGVYLLRVKSGEQSRVVKMVVR